MRQVRGLDSGPFVKPSSLPACLGSPGPGQDWEQGKSGRGGWAQSLTQPHSHHLNQTRAPGSGFLTASLIIPPPKKLPCLGLSQCTAAGIKTLQAQLAEVAGRVGADRKTRCQGLIFELKHDLQADFRDLPSHCPQAGPSAREAEEAQGPILQGRGRSVCGIHHVPSPSPPRGCSGHFCLGTGL